ncbi:hypothetical protein H0B56_09895 [Haloechinothrix sp. YIM 98757]|uniref:Uncharacterized protein n=1 Tax=Haloechinothrix aidingensis TaxID=2752311 RepID=A0A838A3J6_9PSEU|nr:hypothetical protein [Haloechinothrix aidingensis]MBA0125853.1 hypothetical protein [Haloechinothrix aidingensis]
MTRRRYSSPNRTGDGLPLLLIAGVLALFGHLLGPHTDSHVITGASASVVAPETGAVSGYEHTHHQVAPGHESSSSGADSMPAHDEDGHAASCGYLQAGDPENPVAVYPVQTARVAPTIPATHLLVVFGQPAGKRDPPSLVRELQVMRI